MIDRDKPQYLTVEGKRQLEERLEYLRTVKREEVLARIRELNGIGGLVESSEFEDAMTEQAQVERTIRDIEHTLRHDHLLTNGNGVHGETVQMGNRVCVRDGEGYESCWTLVAPAEASTRNGKISNESPIGQALMGKRVGETVQVTAPAGVIEYVILKIERTNGADRARRQVSRRRNPPMHDTHQPDDPTGGSATHTTTGAAPDARQGSGIRD